MPEPRVLLAGDNWFGSTVYSIADGLRLLGWDIMQINPGNYMNRCESTAMRLVNRLLAPVASADYNKAILKQVRLTQPDFFLAVKGSYVRPATLQAIRDTGVKTVNYYPDYHFSYANLDPATLAHYDVIMTTKSFHVDYLKEQVGVPNVFYLPHGYCDALHQPPSDLPPVRYENDVLYIGTYHDEKRRWLEIIRSRFPSIRLGIYGNGWSRVPVQSPIKTAIVNRPLIGKEYCTAIHRARINLAIHMGSIDASGWQDLVSTRTFEIPAARGFMLHIDNHEVRELFKPDEEIGVFADKTDLYKQLNIYLGNDRRREEMIAQAYQRCVPAYGYNARARRMATLLLEHCA